MVEKLVSLKAAAAPVSDGAKVAVGVVNRPRDP